MSASSDEECDVAADVPTADEDLERKMADTSAETFARRVVLSSVNLDISGFQTLSFPHPCDTSKTAVFLRARQKVKVLTSSSSSTTSGDEETRRDHELTVPVLLELQTMGRRKKGSFFVGDSVVSDGTFYVATPIDPLFVAIPYLLNAAPSAAEKSSTSTTGENAPDSDFKMEEFQSLIPEKFLRQLLWPAAITSPSTTGDADRHDVTESSPAPTPSIELICETREVLDRFFVRLSKKKLQHWLLGKLRRIFDTFCSREIYIRECCFRTSTDSVGEFVIDQGRALELACEFLEGYLTPVHAKLLRAEVVPLMSMGSGLGLNKPLENSTSGTGNSNIHATSSIGGGAFSMSRIVPTESDAELIQKRPLPGEKGGGANNQPAAKKPKAAAKKPEKVQFKDPKQLSIFDLMKRNASGKDKK
ncbi:unnamed protein product [Amoebophrya sp. A25]|nr:unnamed protein product [Amoebophrya sp. A25]|eukprot:GSA25T00014188001.1